MSDLPVDLGDLESCFEGAVPAVIATASADGTPNVTYLSRVRMVDDQRIALSNQFMSKTTRNLAENPRASVLLIDPGTYVEYRLWLVYERTERRGPVFEQLRTDVDVAAELHGMSDVFKLRTADIYRVQHIERVPSVANRSSDAAASLPPSPEVATVRQLAEVTARLSRCGDLDSLVGTTVAALDEVLGFEHSVLLLLDEDGERLYTIASHGYDVAGVGSEALVSEGIIGMAAARCVPIRVGNVRQLTKYVRTVRRSYEDGGHLPEREIPIPGLREAESRLAVPAIAGGELVGVLGVEHARPAAFGDGHEAALSVVAAALANAIVAARASESGEVAPPNPRPAAGPIWTRSRTPWSASTTLTGASSSTATTSSRASPDESCGRCSAITTTTGRWSSPTGRSGSTPPSSCLPCVTTSRAG